MGCLCLNQDLQDLGIFRISGDRLMTFRLNPLAAVEQAENGRTGNREARKESWGYSAYVGKKSNLVKRFGSSTKVSRLWQ